MTAVLRDALSFFQKEKFYTVVFLLLVGASFYMYWNPAPETESSAESTAIAEFREAERKIEQKITASGFQGYLREHPEQSAHFHFFSTVLTLAIGCGLVLIGMFFFNPVWRENLKVPRPPPALEWKISMVFKVMVSFVAFSLLMGLLFGLFKRHFFSSLSMNFFMVLHTTLADIFCLYMIISLVKKGNGGLRDLGIYRPAQGFWKEVLIGVGGYTAILPIFLIVLVALIYLSDILNYEPPAHPLVNVFLEEEKKSQIIVYYSILLATFIGPIIEEVFFRGFFYQAFKARFGRTTAMIASAAFFALIHDNTFAFWPIFVLGIGLVYLFEMRSSLVAPIAMHMLHNAVFIGYFFLAKQLIDK